MMNFKSLFLLLTLAGLGVSCSNDDLEKGDGSGLQLDGRSELQIVFKGTGESQEYTRAIATESEDKIDKLEIYLFAAASAAGPYYYLETWNEGIAFDPAAPTNTNFLKTASGTGWKASLYPSELKGLPYLKLMCIANNALTGTTDGKFYQEDGATEMLAGGLTKVTTDADGNNPAGTTEAEFKALYTKNLGADDATGRIQGSLLMTGEGKTKISGSVSKVDVVLKRAVSRFDIENTTAKSSLTIQTIRLAQGRRNGIFWGAEASENGATRTLVEKADLATSPLLTTYQPVTFTDLVGANQGLTTSALYVYPSLATDESYLIIDGTFKSPTTGLQVPVTYHVPIVRTPESAPEGTPGEYIAIQANNRYKLRITDVTQSNILGIFEVVDWTSGGGIVVKPENDAPTFVGDEAFIEGDAPINLNAANPAATTLDYEVGGIDGTGSFKMQIAATGKVTARKAPLAVTRAGEADWLVIAQPTYEERDGVWYSTFAVSYASAMDMKPVAVTFLNEAASDDPDLQTTVNFYAPETRETPVISETVNPNNKRGGRYALDGSGKKRILLFRINGSQVQFDLTCKQGIKAVIPKGTELIAPIDGSNTYTLKVVDATILDDFSSVEFQNAKDLSKKIAVESAVGDVVSDMTATVTATAGNESRLALTGSAPNYTITIDPKYFSSSYPTFSLNIISSSTLSLKNNTTGTWCTLVSDGWTGNGYVHSFTVSLFHGMGGANPCSVTFVDPITEKEVTITFVRTLEAWPAICSTINGQDNNGNWIEQRHTSANPKAYFIRKENSQVQFDVLCTDEVTIQTPLPDGVNVISPSDGSNTYTLIITDSEAVINMSYIGVQNAGDVGTVEKLYLCPLQPTTMEITADGGNRSAVLTGSGANYTFEIPQSLINDSQPNFTFNVKSSTRTSIKDNSVITNSGWITEVKRDVRWVNDEQSTKFHVTLNRTSKTFDPCVVTFIDPTTNTELTLTLKKAAP